MAVEYWPFLVTANQQLDYRVVLCPDFIEKGSRAHVLRTSVSDDRDDEYEGKLRYVQLHDKQIGPFGIFFKEVVANIDGALALDLAGRQVRRIAGLVVQGVVDRKQFKSAHAEKLLDETESAFQSHFEEFWKAGASAGVKISRSIADVEHGKPEAGQTSNSSATTKPLTNSRRMISSNKQIVDSTRLAYASFAVSLVLFGVFAYGYFSLRREIEALEDRLSTLQTAASNSKVDAVVQDR